MDPYAGLLSEIRQQARGELPPGPCQGEVLQASEGLLRIRANGHILDNDDLMVNPMLCHDYSEEIQITYTEEGGKVELGVYTTIKIAAQCSIGSHDKMVVNDIPGYLEGKIKATLTSQRLKAGDQVLMVPAWDGQTYFVVCKVVRPSDVVAPD